jgi:hypothetical protein
MEADVGTVWNVVSSTLVICQTLFFVYRRVEKEVEPITYLSKTLDARHVGWVGLDRGVTSLSFID